MRPLFHPSLVNRRYGDPTVYVETLFEKRSLLFDVGEIASLAPRRIRRIDQIFVSHAHIDHFIGFDRLLRLLVGHEKSVHLFVRPALPSASFTSFRPIVGTWSKATLAILFSL
jgi:ribonuclease Z